VTAELLDEDVDDAETVFVSWLTPLYSTPEHVANTRRAGDPLPFVLINHLDSNENVEESTSDALVSAHILTHKSAGEVASRDEANRVHRRILLLARYLEDVDLAGGRKATIDYVNVARRPKREAYGDDLILRRLGRYELGLSYAKVQ
jgi:hypothetical protein